MFPLFFPIKIGAYQNAVKKKIFSFSFVLLKTMKWTSKLDKKKCET